MYVKPGKKKAGVMTDQGDGGKFTVISRTGAAFATQFTISTNSRSGSSSGGSIKLMYFLHFIEA